ncbi:hypothetical protein AB0939_01825 [Streptomyces sp. NPDC006990]|uniref:hypothetical protein n=1 Tax=unclassified Streptomyces TaxID=2593676 RepID=UPI003454FA7B
MDVNTSAGILWPTASHRAPCSGVAALRIRLLERGRQPLAGQPGEECRSPCILAEKMAEAHEAWRRSLATTSLAEIIDRLPSSAPPRTRLRLTGTP